jgi:hypothetical protein
MEAPDKSMTLLRFARMEADVTARETARHGSSMHRNQAACGRTKFSKMAWSLASGLISMALPRKVNGILQIYFHWDRYSRLKAEFASLIGYPRKSGLKDKWPNKAAGRRCMARLFTVKERVAHRMGSEAFLVTMT